MAQHKKRCGQLEAHVLALDAAAADNAAQLRAAQEECGQLTESLASAEAVACNTVVELQEAHEEITKLEQHVATAEAAAAESQDELRKVQSECEERCQQLESRLAKDPPGSGEKWQALLIEKSKYEERCTQLTQQLAKAETKLDQMGKCQVEVATYKERCRQLERASHMTGGFPAYPTFIRRDPAFSAEASISPRSNSSDLLGFVLVETASSVLSSSSWFSVHPHDCFMLDSIFKTRSYSVDFFLMGRDLEKGSKVVAGDDETILEVTKKEICKATDIVRLQAGRGSFWNADKGINLERGSVAVHTASRVLHFPGFLLFAQFHGLQGFHGCTDSRFPGLYGFQGFQGFHRVSK